MLIKDLEMERDGDKAYDVVERTSSKEMREERTAGVRRDGKWDQWAKIILQEVKRKEKEGKCLVTA